LASRLPATGKPHFLQLHDGLDGHLQFVIATNPLAGDYFYTIVCDLPKKAPGFAAGIWGVKPDH
jgi:hypothetical protein